MPRQQFKFIFKRDPDSEQAEKDYPGENGKYILVDANTGKEMNDLWRTWDWVTNIDNYPDPDFSLLEDEYDWIMRNQTGPVCRYMTCIAGNGRLPHKKRVNASPQVFWLFARGWMEMINNPQKYRDAHKDRLYGGVVCEFINTVPIEGWFPAALNSSYYEGAIFAATEKRRKIIPDKHSALLSRTFNGTVGADLPIQHQLKVEKRAPLLTKCKCCEAISEKPGGFYEVGDEGYEEMLEAYIAQNKKRAARDKTGEDGA